MEVVEIFHNLHNVFVKTGIATKEQLECSVDSFKKKLVSMFPEKGYDKCEILVNLVVAKNQSMEYGYIWVQNPEVYFIMCGFNPDGSQRIEEYIETVNQDEDLEDFTDFDLSSVIKKKQQNTIKTLKSLPPILELPGYEYTESQSDKVHKELIEEEIKVASVEGRKVNEIAKPKMGFFECSRADATLVPEGMSHTTLWGKVPAWVSEDIIKSSFIKYSEDGGKNFKVKMGSPIKEGYPPNFKEVTICFGNIKRGIATFALQMTRKTKFINPMSKEEVECIFNYYKVNNRDSSSNIEHKYKKNNGFSTRSVDNTFINRTNQK
jgi:hypothetical protein